MTKGLRVRVHRCEPNDKIVGPTGIVIYQEPALVMRGWQAWAYLVGERPVGVLIFRGNEATLRYCETDGATVEMPMQAGSPKAQMLEGMKAIAGVIRTHLGERHPQSEALATAAAVNTLPA
jgi:hypothetical protein